MPSSKALDAAKAGKELPYGTVLVAEIYKAKKDKEGKVITSSLGRRIRHCESQGQGRRVME